MKRTEKYQSLCGNRQLKGESSRL